MLSAARLKVELKSLSSILLILFTLTACTAGGSLQVGDPAPEFSLPDLTGSQVSLGAYADRPALLYFHMAVG